MIDACKIILKVMKDRTKKQLSSDVMLGSTVIHQLQILGEAAVGISGKSKQTLAHIPWKKIIGMRNQLIHCYFDVDYDIVWATITEHLPMLYEQLKSAQRQFLLKK